MAKKKSAQPSENQSPDLSKLSTEYNLEKPPLQTGQKQSSVDLRARLTAWPRGWELHEWSWRMLTLTLIAILLLMGFLAEFVGGSIISFWIEQMIFE